MLVAGLGCRRDCSAQLLLELMQRGLSEHGLDIQAVNALATIDLKRREPGLLELAERLGIPLMPADLNQLLPFEAQLTHRSIQAYQHTGCHGIAESAALAVATRLGSGPARLLISRQTSPQATFALASAPAQGR
ncbi:cobalamin biosynthesis protein [Pseudomonas sp. v388]|uniref:cobalamin biosynthesis protein n=1 Tax=Pseudomonas sp. v388 TaxID=2479849 RepID=UPI003531D398